MTDGIKRRNVIREMQKRTIGEALYSKKLGRKPNESAKKIGVLPARQGQSIAEHCTAQQRQSMAMRSEGIALLGLAMAWRGYARHSSARAWSSGTKLRNGNAASCKARAKYGEAELRQNLRNETGGQKS